MRRTPRIFRPHTIKVHNKVGEDADGKLIDHVTTIDFVYVNQSYGMEQSRKGIENDDKIMITIDMNDLVAYCGPQKITYVDSFAYKSCSKEMHFTLRIDDEIEFANESYTINSINEKKSIGNVLAFIEVTWR